MGIRENKQLIAMAGERMRLNGYVEISAVFALMTDIAAGASPHA